MIRSRLLPALLTWAAMAFVLCAVPSFAALSTYGFARVRTGDPLVAMLATVGAAMIALLLIGIPAVWCYEARNGYRVW